MIREVFPVLVGLDLAVTRQAIYSTKVLISASGKEMRATWWSAPRYHYELRFNMLRQLEYGDLVDELATLQGFFDRRRGAFDDFYFDDPVDGVRRVVRFANDELELTRVADFVFEAKKIELVSLK